MSTNFPNGLRSRGVPVEAQIPLGVNNVYWVDGTNGNDNDDGKTLGSAWATVEKFFANDSARDVCIIMPGTYTPATASLPLTPLANTMLIAGVPAYIPNVIISDDGGGSDTDLMDIEVDNFTMDGIMLRAGHADVARLMKVADTASLEGLNILNCWFDGAAFATVNGISAIDGTFILTGLNVCNTHFEELDVGIAIGVLGFKNSTIAYSFFDMQDAGGGDIGISLDDTTALATGYRFWIYWNRFLGAVDAGRDSVGIVIAGTQDTTALGTMDNNYFSNCNVLAITQNKINESIVQNWVGDTGTGGTRVDPGT